jgi:hypothetical protein
MRRAFRRAASCRFAGEINVPSMPLAAKPRGALSRVLRAAGCRIPDNE